jgi:uroporphyrinogen decarboxylase
MKHLTNRERVMLSLNHKDTDRVPIDFGGTISTTIIMEAYDNLKAYLGYNHPTIERQSRAHSVLPNEEILTHYDIDTRPLILGEFSNRMYRVIDEVTLKDAWGTIWKKAPGGHYININGPFQDGTPEIENLEKFKWPDPNDPNLFKTLSDQVRRYKNKGDFALILGLPLGIVHQCQFMRGFIEYLMDMYDNPEYIYRLSEIICGIWIKIAENAIDACGAENISIVDWGDDIGIQTGPMMNPDKYRDFVRPFHQKMNAAIKNRTEAKISYHSCGSVIRFMDDIIEIGVDLLNPLQVSAKNMDPKVLKEKWGKKISFSGGIDTHDLMPKGTSKQVRDEVRNMIEIMAKNGGYILAAVHNIQNDVPPENIDAMLREASRVITT